MKLFYQKFTVLAFLVILSGIFSTSLQAQVLYNEDFATVVPLPAGWASQNLSGPPGTTEWFQGNNTVFPSNSGAPTAYIGANYNNTDLNGTISNWLFMPNVTLKNGDIFTFYTRVPTGGGAFPDRLQVRMSTNGASTNAGASETSVGDFSTLLLDINPTYTSTDYPEVWTQYTIIISGLGGPTSGRLAFRYFVEDAGFFGTNSNYIGIDDAVYTTFSAACSGTPAPGPIQSTAPSICPTIPFTLSLVTPPSVSGLSYQWQSSPDGVTWTNIPGATLNTLTTTQNAATFYQVNVTCAGNTGASGSLQVTMNPATSCYCTAGSPDVIFEKIANVKYNTINNSSTSSGPYENFTAISTTVVQQSTIPMTVTISNAFAADQIIVWIDFNQDGDFTDPGERVYTSTVGVGPHTGNITIPATSLLGSTRMRLRLHDTSFGANATPCGNSAYGEVEDYTVNIIPCIPVSVTNPANATIACGGDATFTVTGTGSGPTYQWQEKTSAATNWTDITNNLMYGGATTNTLTITGAPVSMNGYQYRVVYAGYCRSTDVTTGATLTVNPLVANVSPSSATICNGGSQQLSITNITSPLPGSVVVNSGALALAIPDNDPANGVYNTINVAGVPASAIITGIDVKINATHTWAGDMVFVLQAPNGQRLSVDYYLGATGGAGATTGFTNTVFSSTAGLPLVSTGTNPYTGTWRFDGAAPGANPPSGPTGPIPFLPTTQTYTSLYTNGASTNGQWILGAYDGGPADFGVIQSWEITIKYLAGIPATGVWTGPAGTMWTDAGLTVPYTGTAANTIYVNPTSTNDYTVVVTTPVCVSGPTVVPVTVANPIGTVTDPVDAAVCENGNTSFTVATTAGNPIAYQWQVSTDGGANWGNISNGPVYSGTTTATLTLTNTPSSYNDYRYRVVMNVTACGSTATSAGAKLTVNALPATTLTAAPYTNLYPGITTTITANVSPNAGATFQWYLDGIAVAGANSGSIVVDVDHQGVYTVDVVDVNGCGGSSTSSLTIGATASNIIFIYPSPNTGQFQVRYNSPAGSPIARTLTIFDSKGSKVYSKVFTVNLPYGRMEVDLKNHGKGVYRVELGDAGGRRIATGNVMVL